MFITDAVNEAAENAAKQQDDKGDSDGVEIVFLLVLQLWDNSEFADRKAFLRYVLRIYNGALCYHEDMQGVVTFQFFVLGVVVLSRYFDCCANAVRTLLPATEEILGVVVDW